MVEMFNYIAYCFSLIPGWLTAVFVALCVFVLAYVVMLMIDNQKSNSMPKFEKEFNKNGAAKSNFDDLLAQVLADKQDTKATNKITPDVVAAITATMQKTHPDMEVCSIETV